MGYNNVVGFRLETQIDKVLFSLMMLPSRVNVALGILSYAGIEWARRANADKISESLSLASNIPAPAALCFFMMLAIIGAVHRARRFTTLEQQTGLDSLRGMHWRDFERLVAEIYERQGFEVSYSLNDGPDGGTDLTLRKNGQRMIVQCKRWRTWSVGVSVVREMFGLLHHEKAAEAIIVTSGDFTEEAVNFAQGKPVRLIDGPALWQMVLSVKEGKGLDEPVQRSATLPVPSCPRCGGDMREKTARKGPQIGKRFWGCSRYPDCDGTRALEASRETG